MQFDLICLRWIFLLCSALIDREHRLAYVRGMRWDALFNDLESQLQRAASVQDEGEIRDRLRSEQSSLTLVQRLIGQIGRPMDVSTTGGRALTGILTHVGSQWLALAVEGRSVIVPLSSLQSLRGLGRAVGQPLSGVHAKLGTGSALRALSRDRAHVAVWLGSPASRFTGVIDRVGADFFELGLVAPGDERRASNVRDVLTVPFASVDSLDGTGATG